MADNEIDKRGPAFPRLRHFGNKKPPKQSLPRERTPWQQRFKSKVNVNGPLQAVLGTRCHLWVGSKSSNGCGQFKYEGKVHKTHRVAFLLAYGRWPTPHALHHCDERLCVNPEHLFEGREHKDISEKNHLTAKVAPREFALSEVQVALLRKQFNGKNLKQLAKFFGVSISYATELVYTTTSLSGQETSVDVRA